MVTVLHLQKKFVPFVVQLEEYCFSDSWSAAGVEAELKSPVARFLVAQDAGEVLGYVSAAFVVDECFINRLAVAPAYRRHKVGTQLMHALLERAWSEGMSFVTLEVRESNRTAIAFYEQFGFHPVGVRKNFYRHPKEDAVLMTINKGASL